MVGYNWEVVWREKNIPPDRVEIIRSLNNSEGEARYNMMQIHPNAVIVSIKRI